MIHELVGMVLHFINVCLISELCQIWLVDLCVAQWNALLVLHLCRAGVHGNIEALIKLGIAYLYNEGCEYITCDAMMVALYMCHDDLAV